MSEALGLSKASVETVYRELRESGLVSKAGRGPRSSAKMTARDAATLLVAILGSVRKGDAAGTIKMFSATRLCTDVSRAANEGAPVSRNDLVDIQLPEFRSLKTQHSPLDLIEDVFAAAISGGLRDAMEFSLAKERGPRRIEVIVHKPTPMVDIRLVMGSYFADLRYAIPWTEGEIDTRKLVRHMERLAKELGIEPTGDRKSYEEISQRTFIEVGEKLRN